MNTNYQAPNPNQEDDEITIDWAALFKDLLKHKKYIFMATFISGVLGCAVALMTARKYSVTVTLAPEVNSSSAGGSLKSITSMLGMGNMAQGAGNDAINITLFPEVCNSTDFLSGLFDVKVTPYVSKKDLEEGAAPAVPVPLYDFILGKHKPKSLFSQWMEEFFEKEKKEEEEPTASYFNKEQTKVIKIMRTCITANVDKKTGVTDLSVVLSDPKVAQEVADTVCQRLQDIVTNYRTEKTYQDFLYYQKLAEEAKVDMVEAQAKYAASVDYDRSVILQSVSVEKQRLQQEAMLAQEIYTQMKQQESMAKAKVQEMKPVFAVIQSAVQPLLPSNSRKNVVLAFAFVGFCLSTGWKLFGQKKYQELKDIIKQD